MYVSHYEFQRNDESIQIIWYTGRTFYSQVEENKVYEYYKKTMERELNYFNSKFNPLNPWKNTHVYFYFRISEIKMPQTIAYSSDQTKEKTNFFHVSRHY